MRKTNVSAVILRNEKNEILIGRRAADASSALLWEFPGGKQESGETAEDCAVRECREELDIEIGSLAPFGTGFYSYPDRDITFTFFTGIILDGVPKRTVHQEIRWVKSNELSDYSFCPADDEILEKLTAE